MSVGEYPSRKLLDGEVRLLRLLPGADSDEIACNLTIHQLDNPDNYPKPGRASALPEYEALSYTWGGVSNRHIQLNGKPVPVTDNLFYALRRLRSVSSSRRLWIDALCINQQDVSERNTQIQHMRALYSRASEVIVWLGEPDVFDSETPSYIAETYLLDPELWPLKVVLENQRPLWFDRLWIIQEFATARNEPHIHVGSWRIPWQNLNGLVNQLSEMKILGLKVAEGWSEDLCPNAFASIAKLQSIRALFQNGGTTLGALSLHSSTACAALKKDKVYGLLGLIAAKDQDAVPVDYAQDDRSVFASATFASISASQSLNVLHLIPFLRHPDSVVSTWSIDFDAGTELPYAQREDLIRQLECGTTLDTTSNKPTWTYRESHQTAIAAVSNDHELLTVHGIPFDFVTEVYDMPPMLSWEAFSELILAMFQKIEKNPYRNVSPGCTGSLDENHEKECMCWRENIDLTRLTVLPEVLSGIYADLHLQEHYIGTSEKALSVIFSHWIRCIWGSDEAVEARTPVLPDEFTSLLPSDIQLVLTRCGFLGATPKGVTRGDRLVLLYGCDWPAVLKSQDDGRYTFHALAWVQGIMAKELGDLCDDCWRDKDDFVIR